MKGPGIKDYINKIETLKKEALEKGEKELIIQSKDLHGILSKGFATMPTCCQALYKMMLEEDEIIQRPKGHTGYGSHLVIKYNLENMSERNVLYPPKKRGRPAKSWEDKEAARRLKSSYKTEDLVRLISAWLQERGWQTSYENGKIKASMNDSRWIIDVQGTKRGRKQPLFSKINGMLRQIEDEDAVYSIAFNDSTIYRKQWNEIPKVLKNKLKVSVILADQNGNIQEVK